jgi:hypothetical protein
MQSQVSKIVLFFERRLIASCQKPNKLECLSLASLPNLVKFNSPAYLGDS